MTGFSQRFDAPEIMDGGLCPEDELIGALDFLELTNRFFGGSALVLKYLKKWMPSGPDPVSILDIGCGSAEIPRAVVRSFRSAGRRVEVTGVEIEPRTAAVARKRSRAFPEIRIEETDIFSSQWRSGSYDYVVASLVLHHFPQQSLADLLRTMDRIAKRGMLVSDLRRTPVSYCAVSALSFLAGNRVVRHDGPLSVRRSFVAEELQALAQSTGIGYLTARNEPFFRVSLGGSKHG
jgi:SAM-dependent methyltransferase